MRSASSFAPLRSRSAMLTAFVCETVSAMPMVRKKGKPVKRKRPSANQSRAARPTKMAAKAGGASSAQGGANSEPKSRAKE